MGSLSSASLPLVRLESAGVRLAGKAVLRDVTWSLMPGEHWALLGGNGAGKSTFLRLVRGELWPEERASGLPARCWNLNGTAETSPIAARPLIRMVSGELHRAFSRLCDEQGWSMPGLDLVLSGFGDGFFPAAPSPEERGRALALSRSLGAEPLLEKGVGTLSQGQLRLLLLVRALVPGPRILLLDEPFDGLDSDARAVMSRAIERGAAEASLVCSAHRREDIPSVLTHALVLECGEMRFQGLLGDVPQKFLPGTGAAARPGRPARPGGPGEAPRRPAFARRSASTVIPALELENVDVYLDRVRVLHGVTWRAMPGENWRVSGPNGSGKSTLLRLLAGLESAAWGGTYRCFGREHPPLHLVQRHMAYLSDRLHATYSYDLSGADLAATGFDGSVGLWRKLKRTEWEKVYRWLELLGLMASRNTPLSRLSSGTARRFFLARALVGNPRMLLLDEPCSGLDAPSRALFLEALDQAAATGVQLVYVSHHDKDVPSCVTRTLRLQEGRVTGTD